MANYANIFKGKNFMTPDIITYGKKGKFYYELSEGRGFNHEPIFGVTIRDENGERFDPDRSKLCHSLTEAKNYIECLT